MASGGGAAAEQYCWLVRVETNRNPEAIVSPFFLVNICRKERFISHKSFETIIS